MSVAAILLEPGAVAELRVPGSPHGTLSGYFDDENKLAAAAKAWSGKAPGIYVTLNPVNPALLARSSNKLAKYAKHTTGDKDILGRRRMLLDFDPIRPAGISSTDDEKTAALQRALEAAAWLESLGWPAPLIADSGNGGHLVYGLDLPNDADSAALVRRCLDALAFRFNDQAVTVDQTTANAARLVKLYGTRAAKGDSLPDRPHRMSSILSAPGQWEPVARVLLESLAALLPVPGQVAGAAHGFNLDGWIADHGIAVSTTGPWNGGHRYILSVCPWNPAHTNGSAYIVRRGNGALAAGCHHAGCKDKHWPDLRDVVEPGWRAESSLPAAVLLPLSALDKEASLDVVESALREMASKMSGADPLRRARIREEGIRQLKELGLKSPARLVDAALDNHRSTHGTDDSQGRLPLLADSEPWPDPVDGAALLDALADAIRRRVVLPSGAADAEALWVVFTHALDAFDVAPILAVVSPVKRCGKTTNEAVVSALVRRPLMASNISAAAVFRAVERYSPTIIADEIDTFLPGNEALRGIINSGHLRVTASVIRTVGDNHEPKVFSTWSARMVAGIGRLPDTIEDRAIVVPMRRRAKGETVERVRFDRLMGALEPFRRQAARWAADSLPVLRASDPAIPEALNDRAADNWRPLLAIADAAGGPWPQRARQAALHLSGSTEPDDATGVQLLHDMRTILRAREAAGKANQILSADLLVALIMLGDERPWSAYGRTKKPITQRQVARLLDPFGVHPVGLRVGESTGRGYKLAGALADAFARYLPPIPSATTQQVNDDGELPSNCDPQQGSGVADEFRALSGDGDSDVAVLQIPTAYVHVGKTYDPAWIPDL